MESGKGGASCGAPVMCVDDAGLLARRAAQERQDAEAVHEPNRLNHRGDVEHDKDSENDERA